ncbi:hypothetical protein ACOSQ2_014438 [Xanthoceras sorbifolium]
MQQRGSDPLSRCGGFGQCRRCTLEGYGGIKGARVGAFHVGPEFFMFVALEAQLYLKKKLVSSARKLRDFKEVISSLRRENEFLTLSKSRAKMAKQENAACVEELELVERLETIAGDAVVNTKAKLMAEYKEGKVDY